MNFVFIHIQQHFILERILLLFLVTGRLCYLASKWWFRFHPMLHDGHAVLWWWWLVKIKFYSAAIKRSRSSILARMRFSMGALSFAHCWWLWKRTRILTMGLRIYNAPQKMTSLSHYIQNTLAARGRARRTQRQTSVLTERVIHDKTFCAEYYMRVYIKKKDPSIPYTQQHTPPSDIPTC